MKISIIVDTDKGMVDILRSGYNIITETIYDEDTANEIVELLQKQLDEPLEDIIERKF